MAIIGNIPYFQTNPYCLWAIETSCFALLILVGCSASGTFWNSERRSCQASDAAAWYGSLAAARWTKGSKQCGSGMFNQVEGWTWKTCLRRLKNLRRMKVMKVMNLWFGRPLPSTSLQWKYVKTLWLSRSWLGVPFHHPKPRGRRPVRSRRLFGRFAIQRRSTLRFSCTFD